MNKIPDPAYRTTLLKSPFFKASISNFCVEALARTEERNQQYKQLLYSIPDIVLTTTKDKLVLEVSFQQLEPSGCKKFYDSLAFTELTIQMNFANFIYRFISNNALVFTVEI